jgi:hypothetical protein
MGWINDEIPGTPPEIGRQLLSKRCEDDVVVQMFAKVLCWK